MALARYTPTAQPTVNVITPKIAPPEYQGVVVDTKYTPLSSLISYVEGSIWTVVYYNQIIASGNDLRAQDVGQSALYQQYSEILGMEMKVTSPLTTAQDTTNNTMTVTGSANIYSFIIPNSGDMFVASVGDGREGIFRIKTTEKKSLLKDSVYFVEYDLLCYVDVDTQRRQDLINKTISSYYYVRDFMLRGKNPLLIKEDFQAYKSLSEVYYELIKNYYDWFFSTEFKTLAVPGQTFATYDDMVNKAITAIVTTRDAPQIQDSKKLNLDDDIYIKQPTIWNALLERDINTLTNANTKMGLVGTELFTTDPMMTGIRYSGFDYVVYPAEPEISLMHYTMNGQNKIVSSNIMTDTPARVNPLIDVVAINQVMINNAPVLIVKPVLVDDYYVLSGSFYNNLTDMSLLEATVKDYLQNKAISPSTVITLAKNYKTWGALEKFYYIPILIMFIKTINLDL